jgi:hypothetical protein
MSSHLRAHMKVHEQRDAEEAMEQEEGPEEGEARSRKRRRGGEVGRDFTCEEDGCDKAFKSVSLRSWSVLFYPLCFRLLHLVLLFLVKHDTLFSPSRIGIILGHHSEGRIRRVYRPADACVRSDFPVFA